MSVNSILLFLMEHQEKNNAHVLMCTDCVS